MPTVYTWNMSSVFLMTSIVEAYKAKIIQLCLCPNIFAPDYIKHPTKLPATFPPLDSQGYYTCDTCPNKCSAIRRLDVRISFLTFSSRWCPTHASWILQSLTLLFEWYPVSAGYCLVRGQHFSLQAMVTHPIFTNIMGSSLVFQSSFTR